ncbi:hypothetical protein [Paenibacillus endoradicis]|uniref:hypothetical protein n=1 Tax=Paenibacillus endoradicis TaxID=2972487 RepID=UPI0021591CDB|nr:hypothetical protein [Paenibacillus endoradicis]MCR8659822.1 hypothetical protein [Paenibacillus endoradicis]
MSDYKIVSFDIWDTVLRRHCHPDEIKLHVSRYIFLVYNKYLTASYLSYYDIYFERCKIEGQLGNENKLNGHDDEYSLGEVLKVLLHNISEGYIVTDDILIQQLVEVELSQEKKMSYLDSNIEKFISSLGSTKSYFISDFYTDKLFVEELLKHVGFKHQYIDGYVSSDIKLNKRSGKLFTHFHNNHSILPSNHTHIGDSLIADVESPSRLGITTHHYYIDAEEKKRELNKRSFENRMSNRVFEIKNSLSINAKTGTEKEQLFNIGHKFSSIFYTFVMALIEDAVKKGYDEIYYFTREGEFFKEIHDDIVTNNPYGFNIPKSKLLEVSRVATFAASIEEISLDGFMRLWNQYSTQSMSAFFLTLNLEIEEYKKYLNIYNIDETIDIQYPWLNKQIQELFNDTLFCEQLGSDIKEKQKQLLNYFANKGIKKESEKVYIVDIGWRGTIQDNIATIFSNTHIDGYYFGLFNFINPQRTNTAKGSFLKSDEMNRLLRFVSPIEMLCNSASGSVVGYKGNENKVAVIKKNDDAEDNIHNEFIRYFQEGVLSAGFEISQVINKHAITSDDMKTDTLKLLKELMEEPPYILTKAFFKLAHNEQFGLGKYVDKKYNIPYLLILKAILSKSKRREFKHYLENSSWPQGLMINKKLDILNDAYNKHMNKVFTRIEGSPSSDANKLNNDSIQKQIDEQQLLLEERYSAIMNMEQMIIERDNTIAQQGKLLEERLHAMEEMEQMIQERDNIIAGLKGN